MNRAERIPPGVFTRQMGRDAGLKDWDLHRSGLITRVGSDLYAGPGQLVTPATKAIALARTYPRTWISHTSAAEFWGIPLEHAVPNPHLTAERAAMRIRRAGVACSVDRFGGRGVSEMMTVAGAGPASGTMDPSRPGSTAGQPGRNLSAASSDATVRISLPARIWVELASPNSLRRAVVFGDLLVRRPRARFENRSEPFCSLEELVTLIDELAVHIEGRRPRGLPEHDWRILASRLENLRRSSQFVRVGADSPPETHLRLALMAAGLPEPVLQHPILVDGQLVTVLDLAYPEAKIALHYDGSPHLTPESLARDVARDNTLISLGWLSIRADRSCQRENFRTVIEVTRAALARAA